MLTRKGDDGGSRASPLGMPSQALDRQGSADVPDEEQAAESEEASFLAPSGQQSTVKLVEDLREGEVGRRSQTKASCTRLCGLIWDSGVACMAVASLLQSLSALFVKLTDDRVPVFEMVAIRSMTCMASTLLIMGWRNVSTVFGPRSSFIPLFIRGIAGALSMSLYYFAIMMLPLPDAMTLFFTHPAIVVGMAWICCGEKVGWTGIAGMLASLLGVALVAQPPILTGGAAWSKEHLIGVSLCIGAAFLAAAAFVSIRFVPKSVGSLSVALWFHSMGVATSTPPLLLGIPKPAIVPGAFDAVMIAGIAVCSLSSHTFLARAFLVDNASRVAAAGYLQVVFAHVYGIIILHDPESFLGVLGSLVICCGVVAVSWSQPRSTEDSGVKPPPVSGVTQDTGGEPTLEMLPLVNNEQKESLATDVVIESDSPALHTAIEVET